MKERLKEHIQVLFADAERRSPANQRLAELKEELLQNIMEKYEHLLAMGKSPEAAYVSAIDGIGDISALLDDVAGVKAASEPGTTAAVTPASDGDTSDENGDEAEEEDENEDDSRPPRSPWYKLVSGIVWTVVLCAYFAISFMTHAWGVTWLLFIMGIAADNVAEGIFDLRR